MSKNKKNKLKSWQVTLSENHFNSCNSVDLLVLVVILAGLAIIVFFAR